MFNLTTNINIKSEITEKPVELAVNRFRRDLEMTLEQEIRFSACEIRIIYDTSLEEEAYLIEISSNIMAIRAADSLGCVYALNYISKNYLGIQPFWFWNDQKFAKIASAEIQDKVIRSAKAAFRFRGWFVNDEVLISTWKLVGSEGKPWEMVMEALLRLGGNTIIPGTDHNSKKYADMASDMGFWVTHHHAEPLGAEMFLRAYPELTPSYDEHGDKFRQLWEKGVKKQRYKKVIWNIGFRGQGDRPFWLDDDRYATDESRGALLSHIMEEQRKIVAEHVENPVFCTNLYGEMVSLYRNGHMNVPDDTIKIWGDNGYGKMVSRRQHSEAERTVALPSENAGGMQGVYYHASFYDLQAASHITMLPNSIRMIREELVSARQKGIKDFIIVNCSNVKPHVYYLQALAEIWENGDIDCVSYPKIYTDMYFNENAKTAARLYDSWAGLAPRYGSHEDEGCGDQFYNYTTRQFISQWLKADTDSSVAGLRWACAEDSFYKQIEWYHQKCEAAFKNYATACRDAETVKKDAEDAVLFDDSIGLQLIMYKHFADGGLKLCEAFESYRLKDYMKAFFLLGQSKEAYEAADQAMRGREHGKWTGFYVNDCLTDIKQTAYWLGVLMGAVRNFGDGPHFFRWQREVMYAPEDKNVILITNFENHLTNEELYIKMKLYI